LSNGLEVPWNVQNARENCQPEEKRKVWPAKRAAQVKMFRRLLAPACPNQKCADSEGAICELFFPPRGISVNQTHVAVRSELRDFVVCCTRFRSADNQGDSAWQG
jgi:hypothetical protein